MDGQAGERTPRSKARYIDGEVLSWPGVSAQPHRFGGTEYRLGRREIGHVHGEMLVDVPLPRRLRDALVADGRALPHHVLPESGWVSVPLGRAEEVEQAVAILRLSYEQALAQQRRRGTEAGSASGTEA